MAVAGWPALFALDDVVAGASSAAEVSTMTVFAACVVGVSQRARPAAKAKKTLGIVNQIGGFSSGPPGTGVRRVGECRAPHLP